MNADQTPKAVLWIGAILAAFVGVYLGVQWGSNAESVSGSIVTAQPSQVASSQPASGTSPASARRTLSPSAREDLDNLYDILLRKAEEYVGKWGTFDPFGAAINAQGKVELSMAYNGEASKASDLAETIIRGFQADAPHLRAIGFCKDVRMHEPGQPSTGDAIMVSLEHRVGDAVDVFVPYHKKAGTNEYEFEDATAQTRVARVFKK